MSEQLQTAESVHLQVRCWIIATSAAKLRITSSRLQLGRCSTLGGMRAEVLAIWLSLTLCWVVVCAREDAEEEVQVGRTQGLEDGRQVDQRDVEMSDDPAGVAEVEKPKPKKKKTPEEIEAGM